MSHQIHWGKTSKLSESMVILLCSGMFSMFLCCLENPQVTESLWREDDEEVRTEVRQVTTPPTIVKIVTAVPEYRNTYKYIDYTRGRTIKNYRGKHFDIFDHAIEDWVKFVCIMNNMIMFRTCFHREKCRCEEFLLRLISSGLWDVSDTRFCYNFSLCLKQWNFLFTVLQ